MNSLELTRFPTLHYSASEAINTLCTNLTFAGENQRRIMVTSCRSGEGKSFLSLCIARNLAKLGYSVVHVDADLRKSQVAAVYGMHIKAGDGYGTTHFLAGKCSLSDAIYQTEIKDLHMMPVGRTVSNSLPLLNRTRFSAMMDTLGKSYDYVIVDTPPVGLIIDAAEIAKSCTGVVFAVKYNSIGRKELSDAIDQIEQTDCEVLGVVLNSIDIDSMGGKKYYNKTYFSKYSDNYYVPSTAPKQKKKAAGK